MAGIVDEHDAAAIRRQRTIAAMRGNRFFIEPHFQADKGESAVSRSLLRFRDENCGSAEAGDGVGEMAVDFAFSHCSRATQHRAQGYSPLRR